MEKDPRIKKAEEALLEARTRLLEAEKAVNKEIENVAMAYTEVFEEIVCKRGERFVDKELGFDGFFKEVQYRGLYYVIFYEPKSNGERSKRERCFYRSPELFEKYLKKHE